MSKTGGFTQDMVGNWIHMPDLIMMGVIPEQMANMWLDSLDEKPHGYYRITGYTDTIEDSINAIEVIKGEV
jgi:hypothetical protein